MVLNEGGIFCNDIKLDNDRSMERRTDIERQDSSVCCYNNYGSKSEDVSEDISDLLPDDPFNMRWPFDLHDDPFDMDISFSLPSDPFAMDVTIESTISAITSLTEDKDLKYCASVISEEHEKFDDKFLGELNVIWTSSIKFELMEGGNEMTDGNNSDLVTRSEDETSYQAGHAKEDYCNDSDDGDLPEALLYALGYLDFGDLLSVERVCKSLQYAVQNDPLLWQNIHISYPLNLMIADDDLLRLTDRAQGTLRSLALIRCRKITNIGLKHILERNPRLTKLSMPGCFQIKIDSVLHDLKVFNSVSVPGIKHLRISDNLGITNQQLEEFNHLLGVDKENNAQSYQPRYYHAGELYLPLDDEHVIDIGVCPKCHQARQIYDCPVKSCLERRDSADTCRSCILCVDRCISCGCCLDNTDYEETMSLDSICLDCLERLLDCEETVRFLPRYPCLTPDMNFEFLFYE